jgi:thiamine biosynthesis protein ThiS
MYIVLNGNQHELPAEMSLPQLLDSLGVDRRMIAIAHNGEVVPRDTYEHITVREGDRIEVVRMVGGG